MTLREFLKEIGVDVLEDTQGTMDLELDVQQKDGSYMRLMDVETCYEHEHLKLKLTKEPE